MAHQANWWLKHNIYTKSFWQHKEELLSIGCNLSSTIFYTQSFIFLHQEWEKGHQIVFCRSIFFTVGVDSREADDGGRLHLLRRDGLVVVAVVVDDRLRADDDAAAARLRNGDQK